jgi:peptidyl-prolyl cis-trans isomerase C
MKSSSVFLTIFMCVGLAQTQPAAPPALAPDTVIAISGGKKLTYGEISAFLGSLPPQMQQNAMRSRREFVERYALMRKLSELAEQGKLGERSPYKELIEAYRMNTLMQAEINEYVEHIPIQAEDQKKYYEENKSRYDQAKLKVIYIPFSSNPTSASSTDGKKHLTEEEAKAKAERLVKEARGGADFVKLVKENSEDAASKAKDGDFGTLSRSDNLPEAIRSVIFALKTDEVSEPVRQPNGFYIFRADAVSQKPYTEVSSQIYKDLQNQRLREWLESTTKSLNIKFENEQFFSGAAAPSPGVQLPGK